MASFGSPSTWPVSGTAYGPDIMGNQMVQIQYFQAFLAGSYAFCQLYQLQQTMQMSSCLLPSNPLSGLQYDRGHYNGIAVYAMTAISSRGGTSPYANPNPVVGAAE